MIPDMRPLLIVIALAAVPARVTVAQTTHIAYQVPAAQAGKPGLQWLARHGFRCR